MTINKTKTIAASGLALLAVSAPATAETVYVTAKAYVDVERGALVNDPVIVIEDGVVSRIGRAGEIAAPDGATSINLGDQYILPGMIDMHVHLTSSATKARGWDRVGFPGDRRMIWGVQAADKTLMAGFTTVRDVGGPFGVIALRDAINEGEIPGPRVFASGPPVGIVGGHCSDNNSLPYDAERTGEGVATGPWDLREKVRRNIKFGVDLIKTCSTGGVFSKGTLLGAPQSTVEELKAIVDEAHMRGLKVASHAHGTIGIKNAIEAGVDTIEHASFLDDEAIRMAKSKGVYLSMDIYNTEYTLAEGEKLGVPEESMNKEREVGEVQRESFRKAVRAGAKVVLGSDAAIYPHGDNAKQLSRMVTFGMTNAQALRAATSLAAEALGKKGELGCLNAGCKADLIAVSSNPLEDVSTLETVSFVMKGGEVFKDTR